MSYPFPEPDETGRVDPPSGAESPPPDAAPAPPPPDAAPAPQPVPPPSPHASPPGSMGHPYPPTPGFGAPPAYPGVPVAPAGVAQTDGTAVASLVCGILGLVFLCAWGLGGILSLVALILGLVARGRIKQATGPVQGNGMAVAGIVLGAVGLAFAAIFVAFLLLALGASSVSTV